jgi:polar amino acid transport system permease protein
VNFDSHYFWNLVLFPPLDLLLAMVIVVAVTIASMLGGIALGGLLTIAALSRVRFFRIVNAIYLGFFRGTPLLVQLTLIYFGLPYLLNFDLFPSTIHLIWISLSGAVVAGIMALSLHEAAYMSEITRAAITAIDIGQTEAARSLGMTPYLTMKRIILPQAFRIILPPLGNQCNAMFKTTSLLSVIAVPELLHTANLLQSLSYRPFEVYLTILVYYLLLTASWTAVQYWLEKKVSAGFVFSEKGLSGPLAAVNSEI